MITEKIIIHESDVRKLLSAASADAALLYIYLNSGNPAETAAADLRLTEARMNCAAATLRQLGMWPEERLSHIAPGERPAYTERDVLEAMEPGGEFTRLSCKRNKSGELKGDVADSHQLRQLREYVFRTLAGAVDTIAGGSVEANPYTRGSSFNACRFCPYGAVCHTATVEDRRNYKAMSAQRFWDEVQKEVSERG